LRFPDQRFSVVALCNVANADVEGVARRISDFYLEKQLKPEVSAIAKSAAFPDPTAFAGTYLDPRAHMIYTFTAADGNLMAWGSKLRRLGANEFSDLVGNPIVFKSASSMTATLTLQGETYFSGDRVAPIHLSEAALSRFPGHYHSDELEATYDLSLVNGALTLKNGNQPRVNLDPVAANEFRAGDLGMIVFQVASDHHVSGLTLFSQPARGIRFVKVAQNAFR
jgi:hypothetical protein